MSFRYAKTNRLSLCGDFKMNCDKFLILSIKKMECQSCYIIRSCCECCSNEEYSKKYKISDPLMITKYGCVCNCKLFCIECQEYQFYIGLNMCCIPVINCCVCKACKCCVANPRKNNSIPNAPEKQEMEGVS